jgi:putative transposase
MSFDCNRRLSLLRTADGGFLAASGGRWSGDQPVGRAGFYPEGIQSLSPALRGTSYAGGSPQKWATLKGLNHCPGEYSVSAEMAQSLAKILLHTVFSTKDRRPFLRDTALRETLHHYLGGILLKTDCQPLIVGGIEDHVHLLFSLGRTKAVADVVKELKRGSSIWLKQEAPKLSEFAWQAGYGVFSIGFSQVATVRAYIAGQEKHHRKTSFEDEFRTLLRRYEIEYDERYVWD